MLEKCVHKHSAVCVIISHYKHHYKHHYKQWPRSEAYEGFRTFDLLRNPAPVSLIGTVTVDRTKV